MQYLGILIGIGAAVAFILVGALVLFGGADATQRQLLPGFIPDQATTRERLVTFISVWLPILVVVLFCLLAGVQILRVVASAAL